MSLFSLEYSRSQRLSIKNYLWAPGLTKLLILDSDDRIDRFHCNKTGKTELVKEWNDP